MRRDRLFILLGAMAFAAIVFVLLASAQPVKVIDSHFERAGDSVFVAGDLRNTGAASATLDLEIHYYDRTGRPLGADRLRVGPLDAGAERHFRGPAHAAGSVQSFSLYLNQGRNPYGN
jgi:hypothetical protein